MCACLCGNMAGIQQGDSACTIPQITPCIIHGPAIEGGRHCGCWGNVGCLHEMALPSSQPQHGASASMCQLL